MKTLRSTIGIAVAVVAALAALLMSSGVPAPSRNLAPAPAAVIIEQQVEPLQHGTCGDGRCQPPEDCNSCAQDCGSCCGDGHCRPPEDCNSCPNDCGRC